MLVGGERVAGERGAYAIVNPATEEVVGEAPEASVAQVEEAAAWLDLNRTMQPLFTGSLTSEQWAQLGTAVAVWVLLPLVLGMWRLTRAEVK